MNTSSWAERNERYLTSIEKAALREQTQRIMRALPGLDARAAHILATYPNAEQVVGLIAWAVDAGLIPVEFVETLAKAPNTSWRRVLAYWLGGIVQEGAERILPQILPSLGEAAFACEIRAEDPLADVELQYQAGRQSIDLMVRVGSGLLLDEVNTHGGEPGLSPFYVASGETLAVEFKAYGSPFSPRFDYQGIEEAIRIGRLHGTYAAVGTVSDYLYFYETEKVVFLEEVQGNGGKLLLASISKSELGEWAHRVLQEGRKRHGESG